MKAKLEEIQRYRDTVETLPKEKVCITCLEAEAEHSMFEECKHIVPLCSHCLEYINNKCPVCMTNSRHKSGYYVI